VMPELVGEDWPPYGWSWFRDRAGRAVVLYMPTFPEKWTMSFCVRPIVVVRAKSRRV
jgi:hypothetical protein